MYEPSYYLRKLRQFLSKDVWRLEVGGIPHFLITRLRLFIIAWNKFNEDRCTLRASALTYLTLLQVVPIVAVSFSLFKAFGGLEKIESKIKPLILDNLTPGSGEIVVRYIEQFSENIHAGAIGIVGFCFLILFAIFMLGNIENSLNELWGVTKSRSFFKKIAIYWTIMTISPLFIAGSLTLTTYLQSPAVVQKILELPYVRELLFFIIPLVLTWAAFTLIYYFMPNTSVSIVAALEGGIIAGTLWEAAKWGYTLYNAKVVTYSKIYGSLGAIPIFLIWIFLTWVIVLLGAEVSVAEQNLKVISREMLLPNPSHALREFVTLRVAMEIGENFLSGKQPASIPEIAEKLGITPKLVEESIELLEGKQLVQRIDSVAAKRFSPARPLEDIKIRDILDIVRYHGNTVFELHEGIENQAVKDLFRRLEDTRIEALNDLTLRDLILMTNQD